MPKVCAVPSSSSDPVGAIFSNSLQLMLLSDTTRLTDPASVRKVLLRLSKDDLVDHLTSWKMPILSNYQKKPKIKLVEFALNGEKGEERGFTFQQVAELDIFAYQSEAKVTKWMAYQLAKKISKIKLVPDVIRQRIGQELAPYFKLHLHVKQLSKATMLRIAIYDGPTEALPSPANIIYIVLFPHSDYVLTSTMKKNHEPFISQALRNALGFGELRRMELDGKNLFALTDLLLHQHHQGALKTYRLGEVSDSNPLAPLTITNNKNKSPSDEKVIKEDVEVRKRRRVEVENTFGGEEAQLPQLQTVTFEYDGPLLLDSNESSQQSSAGSASSSASASSQFSMSVVFAGQNVPAGIRSMVEAGLLQPPVPSVLARLPSTPANRYKVSFASSKADARLKGDHPYVAKRTPKKMIA